MRCLTLPARLRTSAACLLSLALPLGALADSASPLADAAMERDAAALRRLLEQGADPNLPGQYDTPALHWLVRVDDLDSARLLLEAGADPNARTPHGLTPLSLAVANGSPAMVRLLLEAGADANGQEPSGEPLLLSAAAVGVVASVEALLEHGAELDARDPSFGQTALMGAAREGHAPVVSLLLARGADPNVATTVFPAPNFIAPNSQRGFGFGVGIIRGGTPKDRGRREPQPGGMTPLHYAARHDHAEVAGLLLDAGAQIDAREANEMTPLLMAISNDQVETAQFLLERGAEVNVSDWYGRSPLFEAVFVRNLYVHNANFTNDIDRPALLPLIQALLEAGADVNARTKEKDPVRHHLLPITGTLEWVDFTGQTPFLAAAYAGDLTVMKLLLEHGADPLIETYEGTNALMAAAGVNWVYAQTFTEGPEQLLEAVKLCHSLGMDVNDTNSMGLAAIHGAANRGSDDIIQYLVDNGARLDILDNEGRSPLDWAKGVFLATHPAEPKPTSIALISKLLTERGMEIK